MAICSKVGSIYLILAVVVSLTEARDLLVGGKTDAWKVTSESDSLNKWAQKSRFNIGDTLVWKYDSKKDSVLQVTREAYFTCNTTNPISEFKNDETKVILDNSGPHYFISGLKDNCDKGEKIIVVVISHRSRRSASVSSAPAPAPGFDGVSPAVAPTSGAVGIKCGLIAGFGVLVGLVFV